MQCQSMNDVMVYFFVCSCNNGIANYAKKLLLIHKILLCKLSILLAYYFHCTLTLCYLIWFFQILVMKTIERRDQTMNNSWMVNVLKCVKLYSRNEFILELWLCFKRDAISNLFPDMEILCFFEQKIAFLVYGISIHFFYVLYQRTIYYDYLSWMKINSFTDTSYSIDTSKNYHELELR